MKKKGVKKCYLSACTLLLQLPNHRIIEIPGILHTEEARINLAYSVQRRLLSPLRTGHGKYGASGVDARSRPAATSVLLGRSSV